MSELRFVLCDPEKGLKRRKAAAIPNTTWLLYKSKIAGLYDAGYSQSVILSRLKEDGFSVTPRQLWVKIQKWGLQRSGPKPESDQVTSLMRRPQSVLNITGRGAVLFNMVPGSGTNRPCRNPSTEPYPLKVDNSFRLRMKHVSLLYVFHGGLIRTQNFAERVTNPKTSQGSFAMNWLGRYGQLLNLLHKWLAADGFQTDNDLVWVFVMTYDLALATASVAQSPASWTMLDAYEHRQHLQAAARVLDLLSAQAVENKNLRHFVRLYSEFDIKLQQYVRYVAARPEDESAQWQSGMGVWFFDDLMPIISGCNCP